MFYSYSLRCASQSVLFCFMAFWQYVYLVLLLYFLLVVWLIRAKIDGRLELRFRELAMRRFGYGKGALSRAVEEAILRWVSSVEEESVFFEGDPVEVIDSVLSDVRLDSVELQHRIKDIWVSRVLE